MAVISWPIIFPSRSSFILKVPFFLPSALTNCGNVTGKFKYCQCIVQLYLYLSNICRKSIISLSSTRVYAKQATNMEQTSLWWIRRDLRLRDNQALEAALATGGMVIPVFILDPLLLSSAGKKRTAFLYGGLRSLDAALRPGGVAIWWCAGERRWNS
jgi:hypothetical protein